MFEKIFLINLEIRPDRLQKFLKGAPTSITKDLEVVNAIHGDTVEHPEFWHAGRGAWGCYRTHCRILEDCYNNNVESYLVFEDDAVFREHFDRDLKVFMDNIPNDWQQLYLGGQLLHESNNPPKAMNDHCFIPYNVNRTHCFGVHKRGYKQIYAHLMSLPFEDTFHIDHHLGRLHESGKFNVYVPKIWLVGQGADSSNISGQKTEETYWPDPISCSTVHTLFSKPVCFFLDLPIDVALKLNKLGYHQGSWLNEHGLDRGVCQAVASMYPEPALKEWYQYIRRECVRDNKPAPCLFHPSLSWEKVKYYSFTNWFRIIGPTVELAVEQIHKIKEEYGLNDEAIHIRGSV